MMDATPKPLKSSRLILGRRLPVDGKLPMGFGQTRIPETRSGRDLITYRGDRPLLTVAPTGAGKTVGPVAVNALTYPGSLILVDVKGEAYRISHARRRAMGQKVHVLDLNDGATLQDALNPLDIAKMLGKDLDAISRSLAAEMVSQPAGSGTNDRFWADWSETMMTAGIAYLLHHRSGDARLSALFDMYSDENAAEKLNDLLQIEQNMNRVSRAAWSSFYQLPDQNTRPCVMGSTIVHLRLFESDFVRQLTDVTTIDLQALLGGKPMTLYIIVPPYRVKAYGPLLRLWLSSIVALMATRQTPPAIPTLMMVDEAAQLGRVESFETAMTLMRGYGLTFWTMWQSLSQLSIYGAAAKTILDNAAVIQVLGVNNHRAAREIVDLIGGVTADALLDISRDQNARRQLIVSSGTRPEICRQVRYYDDKMFEKMRADGVIS